MIRPRRDPSERLSCSTLQPHRGWYLIYLILRLHEKRSCLLTHPTRVFLGIRRLQRPQASTRMSLSSDWAQSQRNGWLCYLYGEDTGTGTKELPAQSIQSQLVTILSNLIDKELSPTECATKTAVLLRDESDFRGFCNNLWGMYFGAVEHFASEDVLQALVYYIVALAQLPDAMNDGHDEGLWKDLPDFKLNLVERFQGTSQNSVFLILLLSLTQAL